jgi:uncharacterized OsmC-like protein
MTVPGIREALERMSATVTSEPMKARAKNAPATARLVDGLRCEVRGPNEERLLTDMPPAIGGSASGPNPGWLLRGALASCTATSIAMRAASLGLTLTDLEVTAESESDHRGMLGLDDRIPAGLGAVRVKVRIAGNAPDQDLRQLVAWGDAHSVVGCTMRQATACTLDVEVVGPAN